MTQISENDLNRPLNVMFMLTSMPVGGAETLLVNLVRRIDRDRFNPMICCLKELGPLGEEMREEVPVFHDFIRAKYDVRVLGKLTKLFQENEVDALVTVGAGDKMFWGRLAAKRARVPVILSALHSTGWPDGVGKLNRMLTPITDGFIAVAHEHGRFLAEFEKFPKEKVFVVPNGIDTDRFKFDAKARKEIREQLAIPQEAPVIGIVAALREEKNHLLFLRVAASICRKVKDAHFLIVGDGPERPKLDLAISDLSLKENVHFLGSRPDVPQVLSAMDLFTLTSKNEASPVSILEAMSCQVPVVAPNVGSIPDTIKVDETGYLFEAGDAEKASELWLKVVTNKRLAERLAKTGREFVIQNGSLNSMVAGYERLIHFLYEKKQLRRSHIQFAEMPESIHCVANSLVHK